MFGIGMPEFLLILVVALVVLGPKKLPELARSLGRGLAELKKTTGDLKQNIDFGDDLNKVQKDLQEVKSDLAGVIDTTFLQDPIPDYLKDTEPQTEVKPEQAGRGLSIECEGVGPSFDHGTRAADHRRGGRYPPGTGRNGRFDLPGTPPLFRGILFVVMTDGLARSPSAGRARLSAGLGWGWHHLNSFQMAGEGKPSPAEQKVVFGLFARLYDG